MEKMARRSEDSTIDMKEVPPEGETTRFNKEQCHQYYYQIGMTKVSYYVYSLFEAICFQCGYFTWEDIRK